VLPGTDRIVDEGGVSWHSLRQLLCSLASVRFDSLPAIHELPGGNAFTDWRSLLAIGFQEGEQRPERFGVEFDTPSPGPCFDRVYGFSHSLHSIRIWVVGRMDRYGYLDLKEAVGLPERSRANSRKIRGKKVKLCQHLKEEKPLTCNNTVPEVGLEPTHLSIPHFECGASANSATRARNT
jgi:hypothetical protein